jgi:hypothetical protein
MLTSTIDAKEAWDVATVDVLGAFTQANMDKTVFIKIEGIGAELQCKIDPDYKEYLIDEKGS